MNYKLINGRIGFPINSLDKVCNKLDDCKISYIVIDGDDENKTNFGKKNNYDKFLIKSKKIYNHNQSLDKLIDRVRSANEEEINDIIAFIADRLDEK